jgi:hypothetical protein
MEKEDTISVQWAQEDVETLYSLLNNNKYTSPTDIGALKRTLFNVLYNPLSFQNGQTIAQGCCVSEASNARIAGLFPNGPVANVYASTESGPGQRRRLFKSKVVVTCL